MPDGRRGRGSPASGPDGAGGFKGLTTRGRCLLAGGLAAIVCAFVLDERDLLRVGIFAAAAADRRDARRNGPAGPADRRAPGVPGPARLRHARPGRRCRSPTTAPIRSSTLEIAEPPTADLTGGVRCLLPPLRPGQRGQTDYPLRADRRGRFLLGPPTVRIGDPFGLWEEIRTLPVRTEVLVVPHVVRLAGMPVSTGSRSAAADRAVAGATGGDPDVGRAPVPQRRRHPDDPLARVGPARRPDGAARRAGVARRGDGHARPPGGLAPRRRRAVQPGVRHHAGRVDQRAPARRRPPDPAHHARRRRARPRPGHHRRRAGRSWRSSSPTDERDPGPDVDRRLRADRGDPRRRRRPASARTLVAARRRNTNGVAFVLHTAGWAARGPAPTDESGRDRSRGRRRRPDRHEPAHGATDPPISAGVALLRTAGWRVIDVHADDDLAVAWGRACSGSAAYQRAGERPIELPRAGRGRRDDRARRRPPRRAASPRRDAAEPRPAQPAARAPRGRASGPPPRRRARTAPSRRCRP